MLKKLIIGVAILLMCSVAWAADWKKCNTSLIMANPMETKLTYNVSWLDHDFKKLKGQYVSRAGGEIQPYEIYYASKKDFRLCPGRHRVIWYLTGYWSGVLAEYDFVITEEMTQIVLSPDGFIVK